jgi:phosphoribosylglycinamide formyltransferase-1
MEKRKISIAVLASGRGSNFSAIIDAVKSGKCNAEIRVLITNNPEAKAIDKAKENKIPVEVIDKKQFRTRDEFDEGIKEILDRYDIGLVVLAGYMLLLKGKKLLDAYKNRIINIHPALLPSFPGVDAQKQAFDYGAKVSGITIHFVDETLDAGPIIYQEAVDISNCKDASEVAKKLLETEHIAYPKVIDSFSKGTYIVEGRKAKFEKSKSV